MKLGLKIFIGILNLIYMPFKLNKRRNKVIFLSRQYDKPSVDFLLLEKSIKGIMPSMETVFLCKKIGGGLGGKIGYLLHILIQMKHLSQSKVAIIDGYSVACSVLHHKSGLQIVQIWHALGAIKQFGYSVIGKKEGASLDVAQAMKMHNNYDMVLVGSEAMKKAYSEAFNVKECKLNVNPMPTVDLLRDEEYKKSERDRIIKRYPFLGKEKKSNVVYAPTFRAGQNSFADIFALIENIDTSKYNLIIKVHPSMEFKMEKGKEGILVDREFSTQSMMMVSDCLITDYSATSIEGAVIGIPMAFYVYDFEAYTENRDFYLDYMKEMPGYIFKKPEEVNRSIELSNSIENQKKRKVFLEKRITLTDEKQADRIAREILKKSDIIS